MQAAYTFSFLREQDIPLLYDTFLASFADYIVPIKLSREDFALKIKREGIEPSFCAGAFFGQQLVGFVLTGLGEWQGKPTAYNAGTGVLPAHRGHRLTSQLYTFMLPKLRESGLEQCLLEVIDRNETASKVYRALGFEITRQLLCFRSPKGELLLPAEAPSDLTIRQAAKPDWAGYAGFCDVAPSWQNTAAAFRKSPDKKIVLEAFWDGLTVGYIAFFPRTGAIAQLAVRRDYRNQGIGTVLLRDVVRLADTPALMLLNVDASCQRMLAFLERRHFKPLLTQHEMLLSLQ
jgi:ribosomal protein S18 acetylase RimI-like enzyme